MQTTFDSNENLRYVRPTSGLIAISFRPAFNPLPGIKLKRKQERERERERKRERERERERGRGRTRVYPNLYVSRKLAQAILPPPISLNRANSPFPGPLFMRSTCPRPFD